MVVLNGFRVESGAPVIEKGDDENLDYGIDWSALLSSGETIASADWLIADGLTGGSAGIAGSVTTKWLSGGAAGRTYTVDCVMTTNQGRVIERGFDVRVVARR